MNSKKQTSQKQTCTDITERQWMEQDLRRNQALLAKAEQFSQTGAWEWDLASGELTFSEQWLAIHGCARPNLTVEELMPIAHPDDRAAIEQAFEELLAGIRPNNIEYRIIRQDNGEARIVQSFGELKRDGEGRPVKVWGASQDITERQRAEKALGASEVFLRNLLDSSLCGVYVYDLKRGTHCFINQRYTDLTGYALERIRSMDALEFSALFHPEEMSGIAEYIQQVADSADGEVLEIEHRFRTVDGRWIWAVSRNSVFARNADGSASQFIGSALDITVRKEAEEALRASETRLRLAQQVARVGTFDFDVASGVAAWTPEMEALHGLEPGQFGGTHTSWEQLLHPDDRAAAIGLNERTLQTGEPVEGEWRVQWPDGSVHWLYGRFQGLQDAFGRVIRLTGVNLDVSERKKLEGEILLAGETERQRLAVELHDGISQELIAISFAARGMQRRLQKEKSHLAPEIGTIAGEIARAAGHTRLIARGMNPVVTGSDGLMDALRELAGSTAQMHRLGCVFECPSPVSIPDPVMSNQLYRIAQEAIYNSVRHSGAKRIEMRLSESGSEICLAVTDNGCGLPGDADRGPGMGLRGMTYRAGLIHGQLVVGNRTGGGVEVLCRVPKPEEARGAESGIPSSPSEP